MNADQAPPSAPPRKKRRWWLYLLGAFGLLLVLGVLALVLALGFLKSVVRDYTSTSPTAFPAIQQDPQRAKELENKFREFIEALARRQNPPPFGITADDLNMVLGRDKNFSQHVRLVITNNQVLAQFSAPLDQTGQKQLKGRFVNGVARVNITFQDGWLTVNLGSVDVNGHRLPNWLLKRAQRENFLKGLDDNQEMVSAFQELESIRVEGDRILLSPLPATR
jgi:hypothetical protein